MVEIAVQGDELAGPSDRLCTQFVGTVAPETINQVLRESIDELASQAKVHTFVPMLAERRSRERLTAMVGK